VAREQWLEVAHLESLGKVLVIVDRLRAARLHIEHLQIETLCARETVPVAFGDALWYEALVSSVHGEGDEAIYEGRLALHARADRLRGHVAAVDDGVAREHAECGRVANHLYVCVLEDVLGAGETFGLLIEAGERRHLILHLLLNLPSEIVSRGLVRALTLAQNEQHRAFDVASLA
jgi:hypothetical protein